MPLPFPFALFIALPLPSQVVFPSLIFPNSWISLSNLCVHEGKNTLRKEERKLATGESLDFENRTFLLVFIPTVHTAAICVWGMLSDIQMVEERRKHLE